MFSKTRIFYYDNQPNTATIGDYTDFAIEVPQSTASYPYLTVSVPGSKHNWSYLPINSYGLFMTFAEIQSLVENSDSFCPVRLEVTIGHTIPLARYPSSTNSTQLSFNNTIYSLIAVNEDGYIGINSAIQDNEVQEFVRTFDGVSASDGTSRATLPKRDMFFRIPYHSLPTTAQTTAVNEAAHIVSANTAAGVNTSVTDANRFEWDQTIAQLIDSYIPELLQNNDNVFTLYPGENQFQKEFSNYDKEFSTLDCSGPSFNETVFQLDQRLNTLINRDLTGRAANNILSLPVLWTLRGENGDYSPSTLVDNATTLAGSNVNWAKFVDMYKGRNPTNDYTNILPKIFVKGVPIVDGDNNLVPHSFCCTITWTLTVDCKPRSDMNTNRLQWRMTTPYLRAYQTNAGVVTTAYTAKSNFATKPYRHNIFKREPMFRYNNLSNTERTTGFTRTALKNKFRDSAGDITKSAPTAPDDLAPSTFGYTLPFAAGWFEGHAFASSSAIPTTIPTKD